MVPAQWEKCEVNTTKGYGGKGVGEGGATGPGTESFYWYGGRRGQPSGSRFNMKSDLEEN